MICLNNLTEKQKRVLEFIEREVERCNYPPSVREICKALGIRSTATVHSFLHTLERKGYITRVESKPRAIKLIKNSAGGTVEKKCVYAPLVGNIAAGLPVLAEENREGYFPIPTEVSSAEDCFVLKVTGDSMVDAGINEGDYVIVRQQKTAGNGEIVVALLDNEATVKRVYHESEGYRLQPANDAYKPIVSKDAEVLGKVIGLYRKI